MSQRKYEGWNPWHGCTKYSEGCRYCYVYRQDEAYGSAVSSEECRKTQNFNLPVKRKRDGSFRIEPGSLVMTCFTSDFLLEDADEWREDCWDMIRQRSDCMFYFFTKRIERFMQCVPPDWGDGYDNVTVGCTCENQDRAEYRLPIFAELPIKHKTIIIAPMLGPVKLEKYLKGGILEVICSGESGNKVRPLNYDWVLDVRRQCIENDVSFQFHQTGAYFIKDGKTYRIPRRHQASQARKAGIDYIIGDEYTPETAL
ncbi:MAG: phage Gp37/Gp68 family protein [Oscillospiraceae bacterium]|nr:phage Gp37/Gp68 family protein [Oscillospiraceae bacterium]